MKRVVFVVTGVLLAMVIVLVGCSPKATPAPAPAPKAPTQNVTGILKDIIPVPGQETVTIQTPQGPRTFRINSYTTFSLGGEACTLDELDKAAASNVSYNCTLTQDDERGLTAIYVTK